MRRIYFDANYRVDEWLYPLTTKGSLDSIAAFDEPLSVGERIVIFMEDLECEAMVERLDGGEWAARADERTWRDL